MNFQVYIKVKQLTVEKSDLQCQNLFIQHVMLSKFMSAQVCIAIK